MLIIRWLQDWIHYHVCFTKDYLYALQRLWWWVSKLLVREIKGGKQIIFVFTSLETWSSYFNLTQEHMHKEFNFLFILV